MEGERGREREGERERGGERARERKEHCIQHSISFELFITFDKKQFHEKNSFLSFLGLFFSLNSGSNEYKIKHFAMIIPSTFCYPTCMLYS